MNDWQDLTTMHRRQASGEAGLATLRICGAAGCWETAHERGYFSQRELDQQ
jgi:hypothetical protein